MKRLNYSKYSLDELLGVKAHIDPDSPNYKALLEELSLRKDEINERQEKNEHQEFLLAEKRVKIVGYFQLTAAIAIALYWVVSLFDGTASLLSSVIAVMFILLNIFAGYTAVKEMKDKYWISILNQALQIPSIALGSIKATYSGLGGAYAYISWTGSAQFGVSTSFSPGFSFLKYTGQLTEQYIAVDFIAVMFIVALITVTDNSKTANKQIQQTQNSSAAD
jgi:hypothetical protein